MIVCRSEGGALAVSAGLLVASVAVEGGRGSDGGGIVGVVGGEVDAGATLQRSEEGCGDVCSYPRHEAAVFHFSLSPTTSPPILHSYTPFLSSTFPHPPPQKTMYFFNTQILKFQKLEDRTRNRVPCSTRSTTHK